MINKVMLLGNVGADPDIRQMQNGNKMASFSLATTESWKDKSTNERKSSTQWHRVVVFNAMLAQLVENYVKKGSKLYVEGALQSREYQDNTGNQRSITEVVVQNFKGEIKLLDSRQDSENNNSFASQNNFASSKKSSEFSSSDSLISDDIGKELEDEIPF